MFAASLENDSAYIDVRFGEDDCAIFVTESSDADEVVGEGTHDVAIFGSRW